MVTYPTSYGTANLLHTPGGPPSEWITTQEPLLAEEIMVFDFHITPKFPTLTVYHDGYPRHSGSIKAKVSLSAEEFRRLGCAPGDEMTVQEYMDRAKIIAPPCAPVLVHKHAARNMARLRENEKLPPENMARYDENVRKWQERKDKENTICTQQ